MPGNCLGHSLKLLDYMRGCVGGALCCVQASASQLHTSLTVLPLSGSLPLPHLVACSTCSSCLLHPFPYLHHAFHCLFHLPSCLQAHIIAVQAPSGRVLPEDVVKLLTATKCALLLYKGDANQA